MKFKLKPVYLSLLASCTVALASQTIFANSDAPVFSKGNGTWLYDAQYLDGPSGLPYNQAGLWSDQINDYNKTAQDSHKLNQLFTYGGDMEMDCEPGSCTPANMYVYYYPAEVLKKPIAKVGDSGFRSTIVYSQNTYTNKDKNEKPTIIPIIDGRIDTGELQGFNKLSAKEAQAYADNVARVYCADDQWAGIQFDLEPFDMDTQNGQYYFYQQIAKDFSGNNPEITACKDQAHPNGRFFSVFTFAGKVNANVASVFNQYNNGYVIDSLYDLGPNAGGIVNTPSDFTNYVNAEVKAMQQAAQTYKVYYQFAIPAAASVHEFEKKGNTVTGYKQIQYIQAAVEAINKYTRNSSYTDPYLLGVNIWGWMKFMQWPQGDAGLLYQPSDPTKTTGADVLNYLSQNL